MNNTPSPISTLDTLKSEYETKSEAANNYKTINGISSLECADSTYLQLLIDRDIAYLEYKKVEIGEPRFSSLHAPVINHRLRRYKDLLKDITGGIV